MAGKFEDFLNDARDAEGSDSAPYWVAEKEGDMIAGEITSIGEGESDYGAYHYVLLKTLDDKGNLTDEEIQVSMLGTVLSNWWNRNRSKVQVGDLIAVKYMGEMKGKSGNSYRDFVVRHKEGENRMPF